MFCSLLVLLIVASVSICYDRVDFPISLSKREAVSEYTEGNPPKILRILIIGDANDNLAVQDWCKADPQRALHTDRTWWKRTTFSASKKYLAEYLKPYDKRKKSWEVRLCESLGAYVEGLGLVKQTRSSQHGTPVLIASMMNKFGVKSSPPFSRPVATLSGLDGKEAANFTARENWAIKDLFREANAPALRLLCDAMGGLPDVVMVHSMHHDISHPPEYKQDAFVKEWEEGMLELFQAAREAFPSAAFFTRTANKFAVQDIEGHWNTNDNLKHMQRMNERLPSIARKEGYTVLDFAAITDPSWFADKMRPSFEENVELIDSLVKIGESKSAIKQKLSLRSTFEKAKMASKQRRRSAYTRRSSTREP